MAQAAEREGVTPRELTRVGVSLARQYFSGHDGFRRLAWQEGRRYFKPWFAEAARQEKMLLTAEGAGEMSTDATFAMDGFTAFEHSLPVEHIYDDVIQLWRGSKTAWTPTMERPAERAPNQRPSGAFPRDPKSYESPTHAPGPISPW